MTAFRQIVCTILPGRFFTVRTLEISFQHSEQGNFFGIFFLRKTFCRHFFRIHAREEFNKKNILTKLCIQCKCAPPNQIFPQSHVFNVFVSIQNKYFKFTKPHFQCICWSSKNTCLQKLIVLVNSPLTVNMKRPY